MDNIKQVSFDNETVKMEIEKNINLNEFEVPLEDSQQTSFFIAFNVFQLYYKMKFNCKNDENMFHGINPEDETGTNNSMELFFDILSLYKTNTKLGNEYIDLYDPEKIKDEKFDDIFALVIDGNITSVSPSLFSLILYLSGKKWHSIEWKILQIKGGD